MEHHRLNIVTGATGYTGKYITRRLLAMGQQVNSLTGHLSRENPFGAQVAVLPFNFDNPKALAESLQGATTLYNTYWVRFSHGMVTFDDAVKNTKMLLAAARSAGVRKIVHISIANPDANSALPYYRGKGLLEQAVMDSGLSYAILRPTVIFGPEDILVNNIAWLLRTFPLFAIAGSGDYQIQPVFVEDVAELAVKVAEREENVVLDAVGPEIFTFNELAKLIAKHVKSRARIVQVPPRLALLLSRLVGYLMRDVVLMEEEVEGLVANLLVSSSTPTGWTQFSDWVERNGRTLGTRYSSELGRHYR
ncbi:MAG: NAD(P)H-binding protein [Candidatus Omnitrophica bacterium]|nr:NAD(P)H-binding protein [Candidatus Omnitrophota bacterium]